MLYVNTMDIATTIRVIVVHSIDLTAGETAAAMMIAGYVNVDNMPFVPSTAVKAKLPHIVFSRID